MWLFEGSSGMRKKRDSRWFLASMGVAVFCLLVFWANPSFGEEAASEIVHTFELQYEPSGFRIQAAADISDE